MQSRNWKSLYRRGQVVREAQRLARSGQYADHATIIPQLERMEDFETARARLEERAFRAQLDWLCTMARTGMSGPWRRLRTPRHGPNHNPECGRETGPGCRRR